jgi:ABC-type nickel/cobalt efflux system permease component RcnA
MDATLLTTLLLGLTLGVEHALDADHVVAVSTILSQNRHPLKAALVGAYWGIGHTLTLLLVGMAVIFLKLRIPNQLALSMEFMVGVVLFVLGVQILWKYRQKQVRAHLHDHTSEAPSHEHFHSHAGETGHRHAHLAHQHKSLAVGMLHGLAGSAALMLLVPSSIQAPIEGVAYILIFGLGSILGMMGVSTLIGLPFALSAERLVPFNRAIQLAAGLAIVGLGIIMMINTGFVEGIIYKF